MQRAQYIRFVEPIMAPGRGAPNISKAHLVEFEKDKDGNVVLDELGAPKEKPSQMSRDELMHDIDVGDAFVRIRNKKGTRFTPLSNVKDWEPAPPAQKETRTK